MKKHTKIYMDYFNYKIPEDIVCEITGLPAEDLNHIDNRGMGGSKTKDYIENLMAMTRKKHLEHGENPESMDYMKEVHQHFMKTGIPWEMRHTDNVIEYTIDDLLF